MHQVNYTDFDYIIMEDLREYLATRVWYLLMPLEISKNFNVMLVQQSPWVVVFEMNESIAWQMLKCEEHIECALTPASMSHFLRPYPSIGHKIPLADPEYREKVLALIREFMVKTPLEYRESYKTELF